MINSNQLRIKVLSTFCRVALSLAVIPIIMGSCSATNSVILIYPDGTTENFTDIQCAVNSAIPNSTIISYGGSYGSIVIDKYNLTIISEGKSGIFDNVSIHPCKADYKCEDTVCITNDSVKIQGFVIYGRVNVSNVDFIQISNNSVKSGIQIYNSKNITVDGNTISCERLVNTTVDKKSKYYWQQDGIKAVDSLGLTIINNVIRRCEEGLNFYKVNQSEIVDNSIFETGWSGIHVTESVNFTIKDNVISDGKYGIIIEKSGGRINNNSINMSGFAGLATIQMNISEISNNTITNANNGLYMEESYCNNITFNDISYNLKDGVYLYNSDNNSITSNTIKYNDGWGLVLDGSDNNNVASNDISNNFEGGILLTTTPNNWIVGNCLARSDVGISLEGTKMEHIIGNTFVDNVLGVNIYESSTCSILGNAMFNVDEVLQGETERNIVADNFYKIKALVDFDPDKINLCSKGKFVTAYITFPEEIASRVFSGCGGINISVYEINVSTIRIGNVTAEPKPVEIKEVCLEKFYDDETSECDETITALVVKFNREEISKLVINAENATVEGRLYSGVQFEGTDSINIVNCRC